MEKAMKMTRTNVVLTEKPKEILLSPSEAKIVDVIVTLHEAYGVQIANQLDKEVQLATVYVLLERLERKGVLISRVEEALALSGRRVIRRIYHKSPGALITKKVKSNEEKTISSCTGLVTP